jgi:hypothetical protein
MTCRRDAVSRSFLSTKALTTTIRADGGKLWMDLFPQLGGFCDMRPQRFDGNRCQPFGFLHALQGLQLTKLIFLL